MVEQIIQAVLGFEYTVDIIVGIFLLVSFIIGFKRGIFSQLWRTFFIVVFLAVVFSVGLNQLGAFVNEGMFQTFNLSLTIDVGGTPHTFNSVQSFFQTFSDAAVDMGTITNMSLYADPDYIAGLALAVSKVLGLFALALVTMLVSWIISWLVFAILFRPILKKKKAKKIGFIGGLLGLVTGYLYILVFALTLGPVMHGIGSVTNVQDPPYSVLNPIVVMVVGGLEPSRSKIVTLAVDPLEPGTYFDSVSKFEVDGTEYNLVQALYDFITNTQASS